MKKILTLILALAMVLSLAACGGSGETAQEGGASDDLITIYTNSGTGGRDVWLTENAKAAGFHVQVVNMGGSDVTNRMISEKNNPLCDVVFGPNAMEFEKMKANGLLQTWEPEWLGGVDPTLVDKDGFYFPVTITPLVMARNADLENAPNDWVELAQDPDFAGKYQLWDLGGGTGKTVYASVITRYADPNGDLGISEEGWEVASQYFGNAHIIAQGEDNFGSVIDGTMPVTMHWASGVLATQNERNYKFSIANPEIGVPFVVESVGVAAGTDKYDLCVKFLNWLGSAETQLAWSNNFGTIPCQTDALAQVTDDIKDLMNTVHPQELDWGFIAENIDAWVEKAELQYVQ